MEEDTTLGMNRTGLQMSPQDARRLSETTTDAPIEGPEIGRGPIDELRHRYIAESDGLGSVPPPGTLRGMLQSGMQAIAGRHATVFVDKLAERAAFERTGVRLYDALLTKYDASDTRPDDMPRDLVEQFRDDEARHFLLVVESLREIGADPTAQTPCADVVGVKGLGLVQTITDPRTNLTQCLSVLLTAELDDHASWELLTTLAERFGQMTMAERFREALRQEALHLERVRAWFNASVMAEAT